MSWDALRPQEEKRKSDYLLDVERQPSSYVATIRKLRVGDQVWTQLGLKRIVSITPHPQHPKKLFFVEFEGVKGKVLVGIYHEIYYQRTLAGGLEKA